MWIRGLGGGSWGLPRRTRHGRWPGVALPPAPWQPTRSPGCRGWAGVVGQQLKTPRGRGSTGKGSDQPPALETQHPNEQSHTWDMFQLGVRFWDKGRIKFTVPPQKCYAPHPPHSLSRVCPYLGHTSLHYSLDDEAELGPCPDHAFTHAKARGGWSHPVYDLRREKIGQISYDQKDWVH